MARKWGSPKQRAALKKMLRANKARRSGGSKPRKRRAKTRTASKPRRTYKRKGKKKMARRRRSTGYSSTTEKAKVAAMGALLGYGEKHTDYFSKVPILSSQGTGTKGYAVIAVGAHFASKQMKSKWLDRLASAAAVIAAFKMGENKMTIQGPGDNPGGSVGFDDAVGAPELSGEL